MSQTPRPKSAILLDDAPGKSPEGDAHAVHRINMSWLVRLRWAAILGQSVVIAFVRLRLSIVLPLRALALVLAVELLANVAAELWLSKKPPISEPVVAAALAFDVSCFSALLYFTGGPLNPFSFLYVVHIALAALVLRARWAWTLVLFSVGANGALFAQSVPLPMDHHHHHMMMPMGGGEPLDMHLRGMWVAYAVAAAFIVYFINRMTRALSEREHELTRAREIAARGEKLASMATLAAGAAHELATPLSTIAVVATELANAETADAVTADALLIREQVERCRGILGQMAEGAGESPGEMAAEVPLAELVREMLAGLPSAERVTVRYRGGSSSAHLVLPRRAMAQALRNIVKNGLDASAEGGQVLLEVVRSDGFVRFEVLDAGTGMPKDVVARATEPFFTTKAAGRGMGLGLFLTKSVVDQLGGTLDIDSSLGSGTRVTVSLPASSRS